MQPFLSNRAHYAKTLFTCMKMIEVRLESVGLIIDRKDFVKALKSVETPSLEQSAAVASGLYQQLKNRQSLQDLLNDVINQEKNGESPHFILKNGTEIFRIGLAKCQPGSSIFIKDIKDGF